ncbi:MAG: hypothetical protein GEEBNDBF_00733 [bacterium]|nr:hypothetical protein [bacterium]
MPRGHRGMILGRSLALVLILAQGSSGGFCKKNPPPGATKDPSGGRVTATDEVVPESPDGYVADVPDLGPVGPVTLETVGETTALVNATTIQEALSAIDSALQDKDMADRYLAVDGLINVPWGIARPRLEAALKDADKQVVMMALQQLSFQQEADTTAILEPYMAWDDLWRRSELHEMAFRPRQEFITDATPIEALARRQFPATKAIIKEKLTAADDVIANIQGVRLAERFGAKHFTEELAAIFNGDPEQSPPYHAAKVLYAAGINKDSVDRFLRKGLDPSRMLPSIIVTGMAKELNRTDWEPELRGLMQSPDPTIRGQALEALGLLGLPLSDVEIQVVLNEYDARGRILQKLHLWADPQRFIPLLEPGTQQGDEDYYLVQLTLARLGHAPALERLLAAVRSRTSDHQWRRETIVALNALAELDHPAVATELINILNSPDPPVRVQYACLQGLGRLMDPASLPSLVRYYRNYSAAQPGLAAYAAGVAIALADPTAQPSQPPASRLIWPVPGLGRMSALYPARSRATTATGGPGT